MPFSVSFGRKGGPTVTRIESVFGLTERGKHKVDEYELSGPELEIAGVLAEDGPSTIKEITDKVRFNNKQVKFVMHNLIKKQLVRVVRGEGVSED